MSNPTDRVEIIKSVQRRRPSKDDRDGAGRLFQCRNGGRTADDNEVRCRVHWFRRVSLDADEVAAGKPMLDLNVAVLGPSERRKSPLQR
jgi:hypothetical protein